MAKPFIAYNPTPEDYWRGIILYGRNVASYKFALARALLDLRPEAGQLIKLEDLSVPYSSHLCSHLKSVDKQITASRSKFLDACRKANRGELSQDDLVAETVKRGFNNVIDAFHVVGGDAIAQPFFIDERAQHNGIRIADGFSKLLSAEQINNLPHETEARWSLVETAWELGLSTAALGVRHDIESTELYVIRPDGRRKSVSGTGKALNGYQKGHCFYCFKSLLLSSDAPPDVDHFFPHVLHREWPDGRVDGIWNLVLSCKDCNRGQGGKWARVPSLKLLERLNTRNEWLIASHHPLRETLIMQTGKVIDQRHAFLNSHHKMAKAALIHEWEPDEVQDPLF